MKTSNLTAVSIFSLAGSIVVGSWLISSTLRANAAPPKAPGASLGQQQLLTEKELAKYLGISYRQAVQLGPLPVPGQQGSLTSKLPFIKIGQGIYFPRAAVNKWLSNY